MKSSIQTNIKNPDVLLSIIVPCFNCEKFIYDALCSLADFNKSELEILLIDDGSTDNTKVEISKFINAYKDLVNIKVFSQKNSGVSAARNLGIDNANGRYIGFLDADDKFLSEFYSNIYPLIKNRDEEIIEFGFIRFDNNTNIQNVKFKPLHNFKGSYFLQDIIEDIHASTVWFSPSRIYKRSLWDRIRFPIDKCYAEDAMTIPKIFLNASSIYFINKPLYGYRYNSDSVTSNHSVKHLENLVNFYWSINKENSIDKILKIRIARGISFFVHELKSDKTRYLEIRQDVTSLILSFETKKKLLLPDLIYFLVPSIYDLLNGLRLRNKKGT